MFAKWFQCSPDAWLQHVMEIHFHPERGTRYWLEKVKELGLKVPGDIKGMEDLLLFGPMDEKALAVRPIEDFVPQVLLKEKKRFVLGDTGGTTGVPKVTAYRDDEFYLTFVEYFGYVAESMDFPKGLNWIWIGPGGPHIIGKAARMLALRMESMDPFAVDFDPRWIKRMTRGSLGWERYFQHLVEQALHILNSQDIGVLFSTPPVIEHLAIKMGEELRHKIKGVHYGGLPLEVKLYQRLKTELFPNAVHLSGYGNTLFGVCLEVEASENSRVCYFSPGPRLIIRIVPQGEDPGSRQEQGKRLSQTVKCDETGQVVFHRLDESCLILNMFERDQATRILPSPKAKTLGLTLDGLADPWPMATLARNGASATGLY